MAKVNTPFISFAARGRLGRVLVAARHKGTTVLKPYVTPSNPNTPAQQAQRVTWAALSHWWNSPALYPPFKISWALSARQVPTPTTGFNSFMQNAVPLYNLDPPNCLAVLVSCYPDMKPVFYMRALDSSEPPAEAGFFDVFAGPNPSTLSFAASIQIEYGTITCAVAIGPEGEKAWTKLTKDGYDRSGIFECPTV